MLNHFISILVYQFTSILVDQYTSIPVYQYTSIPVYQYTSIPVYQYTSIPVYQYTSIYSPPFHFPRFGPLSASTLVYYTTQTHLVVQNHSYCTHLHVYIVLLYNLTGTQLYCTLVLHISAVHAIHKYNALLNYFIYLAMQYTIIQSSLIHNTHLHVHSSTHTYIDIALMYTDLQSFTITPTLNSCTLYTT